MYGNTLEIPGHTQQFTRKVIIRLVSAFIGACAYATELKCRARKNNSDLMLRFFFRTVQPTKLIVIGFYFLLVFSMWSQLLNINCNTRSFIFFTSAAEY